jgi:hypothetical protein
MTTPSDMELFRKQYLATLKLQAEINKTNLQANQLYVKTGMPPSVPLDTRTTTERVADIVNLRSELTTELKQIADGQNAQAIVAGMNADQLLYVSQHIKEIISIIKPKYKYGIPADIFLTSFLPTYMSDQFRVSMMTSFLPQNPTDAAVQPSMIFPTSSISAPFPSDFLPSSPPPPSEEKTSSEVAVLMTRFMNATINHQYEDMNRIGKLVIDHPYASSGEIGMVTRIIGDMKSEFEKGKAGPISQRDPPIYNSPHDLPHPTESAATLLPSSPPPADDGSDVESTVPASYMKPSVKKEEPSPSQEGDWEGLNEHEVNKIQQLYDHLQTIFPDSVVRDVYDTDDGDTNLARYSKMVSDGLTSSGQLKDITKEDVRTFVEALEKLILPRFHHTLPKGDQGKKTKTKEGKPNPQMQKQLFGPNSDSKTSLLVRYAVMNKYLANAYNLVSEEAERFPIHEPKEGWGIDRASRLVGIDRASRLVPGRHRAVGRGLSEGSEPKGRSPVGLSQAMKWSTFGKYRVDIHKLDNGILALRTSTGSAVAKYPTQRLASAIVPVLQTMLDGKSPSFEILSKLEPEDKSFVKRLTKNAHVFSHVGQGLPSNPADDEDVREFEIMKGEITSGNDSTVLIRNFKKQIIKLMSRDLLPKPQGKDLLLELAALGH